MVRRKLDGNEKLCRVVSVKLTPPDHESWVTKVKASGLSSSEFFRQAVLANRTTIVEAPSVDRSRARLLGLYAGLSAASESLVGQAVLDRDRGQLGIQDYMKLLVQLSEVLRVFREEFKNAG